MKATVQNRALNSVIATTPQTGVEKTSSEQARLATPSELVAADPVKLDNGPELWSRRQNEIGSLSLALDFHRAVTARVFVPTQKIADVGSDRPVTRTDTMVASLTFKREALAIMVEGHGAKAPLAADGSYRLEVRGGSLQGRAQSGQATVDSWNLKFEKAAGERKDLGDISSGLGPNWISLTVKSTASAAGAFEIVHPQTEQKMPLTKYAAFDAKSAQYLLAVLPQGSIAKNVSVAIDAAVTSSEGGLQVIDRNASLQFALNGSKTTGLQLSITSAHGGVAAGTLREDGRFFLRGAATSDASLPFVVSGQLTRTGEVVFDHIHEEYRRPNVIPTQISRLTSQGLQKAVAGKGAPLGLFKPLSLVGIRL